MFRATYKQKLLSVFIILSLIFTTVSPIAFADSAEDVSANTATSNAPGFTVSAEGCITQEILDEINSELNFDNYTLPNNISTQNFSALNTPSNPSNTYITQELLDEINSELDLDEYIEARSAELNAQLLADLQTRLVTMDIDNVVETNMVGVSAPVLSLDSVGDYFVGVSWTPAIFVGSSSQILYDVYVDNTLYETTEYTGCGGIAIGHDTSFSIYVKAYLEDDPSIYVNSNTVTGQTLEANPPDLKPVVLDQPVVNGTSITLNWHEDTSSTYENAGYFGVLVFKDGEYDGVYTPSSTTYTYANLQDDVYYEFYIMSGYMYYGFIDTTSDCIPFYNGNSYFLTKPVLTVDSVTDYFVGISWTPAIPVVSSEQVEYDIYLDGSLYETVSYTGYGGIGVGLNTSYSIYVDAVVVNKSNKSILSNTVTGWTLEADPPELKPIIFDQPVVSGTSITLNWHEDATSTLTSADYMAVAVFKNDVFDTTYSVCRTSYTYTNLQPDVYYKFIVMSGYMYYGYIQSSSHAVPFYNGNIHFLTSPELTVDTDIYYGNFTWTEAISLYETPTIYKVHVNNACYTTTSKLGINNVILGLNATYDIYIEAYTSLEDSEASISSNRVIGQTDSTTEIGLDDTITTSLNTDSFVKHYYFEVLKGQDLEMTISLSSIPVGYDYDIQLYYNVVRNGVPTDYLIANSKSSNSDKQIVKPLQDGLYYIKLYSNGELSSADVVLTTEPLFAQLPLPTSGFERAYEPERWNVERVAAYNCYNYALNLKYIDGVSYNFMSPGEFVRVYDGNTLYDTTGETIVNLCKLDAEAMGGVFREIGRNEKCEDGNYKVALVLDPGMDYHWYRQNPDGTWSHKSGAKDVRNVDWPYIPELELYGDIINDPLIDDRIGVPPITIYDEDGNEKTIYDDGCDYIIFVGYFEVKSRDEGTPASILREVPSEPVAKGEVLIDEQAPALSVDSISLIEKGMTVSQVHDLIGLPQSIVGSGVLMDSYQLDDGNRLVVHYGLHRDQVNKVFVVGTDGNRTFIIE